MRYDDWKVVFSEQRKPGGFEVWSEPFTTLRVPKIFRPSRFSKEVALGQNEN